MKYRIDISKDGQLTNSAQFDTMEELNAWKEYHVEIGTFCFEDNFENQPIQLGPDIFEHQIIQNAFKTHDFEIIEIPDTSEQDEKNSEALALLESTDWYVARYMETGKVIPSDIMIKRQLARESIVRN